MCKHIYPYLTRSVALKTKPSFKFILGRVTRGQSSIPEKAEWVASKQPVLPRANEVDLLGHMTLTFPECVNSVPLCFLCCLNERPDWLLRLIAVDEVILGDVITFRGLTR